MVENLFDRTLDPNLVGWLERPFGEEEVNEDFFGMDEVKSPGPDGFSMLFY